MSSDLQILGKFSEYRGFDDRGWICDTCGQIIEKARDGWVQWRTPEAETAPSLQQENRQKPIGQDLQLVHHVPASPLPTKRGEKFGCQFDYRDPKFMVSDLDLESFLGPDGLMQLLAMIAEGDVRRTEVLEMIKRLHIPGYEHTRMRLEEAVREGVFEPNTAPGYYWQSDIEAVKEWLKKRDA